MRGLGDPDAFPVTDLGVRLAAKQLGLPAIRVRSTEHSAGGDRGGRMPPSICGPPSIMRSTSGRRRRSDVTLCNFAPIDSPVGTLTLAGKDGRLMHLRMVDQTYEPSRDGWEPDDAAFPEAVEQLEAYFAGDRTEFDLELDLVGTAVPAAGVGRRC